MSFEIKKTVTPVIVYNALAGAAIKGKEETLKVKYTVTSLISLTDSAGIAEYTIEPENASLFGSGVIEFEYSGSGNPLEEAEAALKLSLA